MKNVRRKQAECERLQLVPVNLMLAPEDRDALQREALQRRLRGEARRIDMSAIVRGLVAEWRAGRNARQP